ERFGAVLLDRPSPAAEGSRKSRPELWARATARFDGRTGDGVWIPRSEKWKPANWYVEFDRVTSFRFVLDALPSGQVGVFPEHRENWEWITRQVARVKPQVASESLPRILNLFAYTGGSTLAAAAAGAEVVHVDAARSI